MSDDLLPCPLCGKQPMLGDVNYYCTHYATPMEGWIMARPSLYTSAPTNEAEARLRWNDRDGHDDPLVDARANEEAERERARESCIGATDADRIVRRVVGEATP